MPNRTTPRDAPDEEIEDELDENDGLLASGQRARAASSHPSSATLLRSRLCYATCAVCVFVTLLAAVRTLMPRDVQKPLLDATAVQQLEASLHKQRKQLLQLQSHLARNALSDPSGCIDTWAMQYPLELDKWDGHSCAWKKKWGQCGQFMIFCARTCGTCMTQSNSGDRVNAASPQQPAAGVAKPTQQVDVSVVTVDEDDEDPEDALPPVTVSRVALHATATVPHVQPAQQQQQLQPQQHESESSAAETSTQMAHAGAPEDNASSNGNPPIGNAAVAEQDPVFVSGARTGADVLTRVMRDRKQPPPSLSAAPPPPSAVQPPYRYGDDVESQQGAFANADERKPVIDDSYEGPQSARAQAPGRHPPRAASSQPGDDRAYYVAGEADSVTSIGSECGIPIREPAVSADFAMAAFQAKPSTGPRGRRYTTVTYLSSVVALQQGEVSQIIQSVKLTRPEGAVGVVHYAVELMQQAASEVRPVRDDSIYLKRLAFRPSNAPLGSRAISTCPSMEPPIVAGAGLRHTEVRFPHPYGVLPNASDTWMAELHLVRTEGLAGSAEHARQCVCMREEIGSIHCCPHSCRFPTSSTGNVAAHYRVSLMLTWRLRSSEDEERSLLASSRASALRPLSAVWIPVGGPGAALRAPRPVPSRSCAGLHDSRVSSTEFDAVACGEKTAGSARCSLKRYGPWLALHNSLLAVTALSLGAPRVHRLALVAARSEDEQRDVCPARDADDKSAMPCNMLRAFGTGSKSCVIQARAELDLGHGADGAVRGADAGFILWVTTARRRVPRRT